MPQTNEKIDPLMQNGTNSPVGVFAFINMQWGCDCVCTSYAERKVIFSTGSRTDGADLFFCFSPVHVDHSAYLETCLAQEHDTSLD